MKVVAIIGTKGPFPRLLEALADYRRRHPDAELWAQFGAGTLPDGLDGASLIPREDLLARVADADAVVCHAGSGTVGDVLALGHVPVVCPRRAHLGEHINDHQLELVDNLGARIVPLLDVAQLDRALAEAAARRGEAGDAAGGRELIAAVKEELGDIERAPRPRRRTLAWTALRALTLWVPRRDHRWQD